MNNRLIISSVLLVLLFTGISTGLWADTASLSYVEGQVSIERAGGGQKDAAIGDSVITGDTIYTGSDGFAEISMNSGSTISIQAGTVFNVGEVSDPEAESRKRGFFRVLLGSVGFKFRNLTQEPDVGTPLTVCSVRGTDFTVFTAPDGASMTVVSNGLVEVSSAGKSTLLAADEGVEAVLGLGLGEKFDAKRGFVRYDAFVKQSLDRFDENPVDSIKEMTITLQKFISEAEFYLASFDSNFDELESRRELVVEILDEKGLEEAEKAKSDLVIPIQNRGYDLNTTYRFHMVSALTMRRYLFSSIYIRVRSQYLTDRNNPIWIEFSRAYSEMLDIYENSLVPILEESDL